MSISRVNITCKHYQISDNDGSLDMDPVENVSKDSLDSNNVYVLDSENECFVWVGAGQFHYISPVLL